MAWIESHQDLVHHPKLFKLVSITGWRPNEAIGLLHRLWWWSLSYAESGYLGEHLPEPVSRAIDALETDQYKHADLFKVLVEAKFITKNLFIWDWLDYAGRYFTTKYRTANPDKLADIKDNFNKKKGKNKSSKSLTKIVTKSDTFTYLPTYLNKPTLTNLDCALEEIIIDCKNKDKITALILSDDFLEQYVVWSLYRKDELKKKLTKSGIKGQFDKLAIDGPDIAIIMIQKSIDTGWTGLFELKDNEKLGYQLPQRGMSAEQEQDRGRLKRELKEAEEALHLAEERQRFNPGKDNEKWVQVKQREVNRLRKELDI